MLTRHVHIIAGLGRVLHHAQSAALLNEGVNGRGGEDLGSLGGDGDECGSGELHFGVWLVLLLLSVPQFSERAGLSGL